MSKATRMIVGKNEIMALKQSLHFNMYAPHLILRFNPDVFADSQE